MELLWRPDPRYRKAVTRLLPFRSAVIEDHNWSTIHPDLRVTISMGICSDTGLKSFEEMLRVADTRLYHAKESGRNGVCAGGETDEELEPKILLESLTA